MAGADAEVKVGADTRDVERAAGAVKKAWEGVSSELAGAVYGALRGVASGLADVALAQGKVNFASQHQQVRDFEAASARLAVAQHEDQESLRRDYEATGLAIGKRPAEVAAWTSEVGRLTYNFKGAHEGMRGINALALETGQTSEHYRALQAELQTTGKVSGDTAHEIGVIAAQAEKLKLQGGTAAFADEIMGLGDTISHFHRETTADFNEITALAGTLGKGLEPAQQRRVAQGALGALSSDPMGWSRYLGRDVLNAETGQVEKPGEVLRDVMAKIEREFGSKEAKRVARLNLGAEVGTAAYNAYKRGDLDKLGELAAVTSSDAAPKAQAAYTATDAGKRDEAQAELAKSSRELFGSATVLGKAVDALQQFAAAHPVASTAGTGVVTGVGGVLAGVFGKSIVGAIKEGGVKGALGLLKGGVGTVAKAAPYVAAFAGGAAAGWFGTQKALDWNDRRKLANADEEIARARAVRDAKRAAMGWAPIGAHPVAAKPDAAQASAATADTKAKDDASLAQAIAGEMKKVAFRVVNMTGGPIAVVEDSQASPAAGSQATP